MPEQGWFEETKRKYLDAKRLADEESLRDPPNEPYKSKYAAKEIFETLLNEIKSLRGQQSVLDEKDVSDSIDGLLLSEALLHYEIGSINLETEELSKGEENLNHSLNLLRENFSEQVLVSISLFQIVSLNQLSYLWCERDEKEKACFLLHEAESIYESWSKLENSAYVLVDFSDAFAAKIVLPIIKETTTSKRNAVVNINKAYTMTCYFLAQVYESLDEREKSAKYCNITLKRQYAAKDEKGQLYDSVDWALNAATLSQYYANNDQFNEARHYLACAQVVMERSKLQLVDSNEEVEGTERYKKCFADLCRIVVKYTLMLLGTSFNALRVEGEKLTDPNRKFVFQPYLLNDLEVADFERTLKTFPILTVEDARGSFKYGIECLNKAKCFYTLDERASDYVDCVQDQSKLYRQLAFFELNIDNQCKMHKRRIDLLEELMKELNPEHFLLQCRFVNLKALNFAFNFHILTGKSLLSWAKHTRSLRS